MRETNVIIQYVLSEYNCIRDMCSGNNVTLL